MNRKLAIGSVIASVFAVIALCASLFSVSLNVPKVAQADELKLFRNVTLGSIAGYTGTTTTTLPVFSVYYGSADCFSAYGGSVVTAGAGNTATVKFQASQDGTNWADVVGLAGQAVSGGTLVTRTNLLGNYLRASIGLANTQAVTVSILCKLIQNTQ